MSHGKDYIEEINMKEVGLVSLKVKFKDVETIIFDDEFSESLDTLKDEEVENNITLFVNGEMKRLETEYGDNIPEFELASVKSLSDSMRLYWQTQSSLGDEMLASLEAKMTEVNLNSALSTPDEKFSNIVLKDLICRYIKERIKNKELLEENEKLKISENKNINKFKSYISNILK